MKNSVILTQQNGSFNLRGEQLLREELALFFDLLGFDVDHRDDDDSFFANAQISLQEVTQEEFDRVYDDFIIWKRISDVQRESQARLERAYVVTV